MSDNEQNDANIKDEKSENKSKGEPINIKVNPFLSLLCFPPPFLLLLSTSFVLLSGA